MRHAAGERAVEHLAAADAVGVLLQDNQAALEAAVAEQEADYAANLSAIVAARRIRRIPQDRRSVAARSPLRRIGTQTRGIMLGWR